MNNKNNNNNNSRFGKTLIGSRGSRSNQESSSSANSRIGCSSSSNNNVLFLQQSHVNFEPPNRKVSVFFDECNREIINLTSGIVIDNQNSTLSTTKTKVLFQATDSLDKIEFMLPIEKRILSIKLNSTRTVLAYHVEKSNIEFINVCRVVDNKKNLNQEGQSTTSSQPIKENYILDDKRYIQSSRAKNSKLFGFLWTGPTDLVMITDISIEYYHVESSLHRLKHIKSFQSASNWFVYQPCLITTPPTTNKYQIDGDFHDPTTTISSGDDVFSQNFSYSILMVSTGSIGNSMQPYMISSGQIYKLQKFDVDGNWNGNEKLELFERSITIASIYGQVRLLVLQHESLNVKSKGAQIILYTVDHESGFTNITHTLDLDVSGRFAINILDNLIVAHDQPSRSSFIFDIMVDSTEKSDCSKHFVSLIGGQTIKPLMSRDKESSTDGNKSIEMYSINWVFFQPNFIIDAKIGLLCTLHLNLDAARESIQDSLISLNFLAHRKHSEQIILNECRDIVARSYEQAATITTSKHFQGSPLMDVSSAFEILSKLIISAPEINKRTNTSIASSSSASYHSSQQKQTPASSNSRQQQTSNSASALSPSIAKRALSLNEKVNSLIYSARFAQEDIHREVLMQLDNCDIENPAHLHFVTSTLLELIFALKRHDKRVDFCIEKQLVDCLMKAKRFYQLIQMIRANILNDSKQLACLLLTHRNIYPPASQLGLDMLQRLDCLTDLVESLSLAPNATSSSRNNSQSDTASRLSVALYQSIEVDAN